MFCFGQLWLFFCFFRCVVSAQSPKANNTMPRFPSSTGSVDCETDASLLFDAKWYFVVTSTCQLLANSVHPINVSEIWLSDNPPNDRRSQFHFCTLLRPSVFPVSSSELGILIRTKLNYASFTTVKLEESQATNVTVNLFRRDNPIPILAKEKTCHLHKAKKIIRCHNLVEDNGQKFIEYTDYEGDDKNTIKPYRHKKWPIPPSANIKGLELLSYYDDYTQTDRIWMEHNLQWLYNLDMDDQDERGNKTTRLTTYHLANRDVDRPHMVPVYSDANGLVTAHCARPGFDCRYIYNRVDAKSAMDGTCLLQLPYLTVVGVVTPLQGMDVDKSPTPPTPQALVQEEEPVKEEGGPGGFAPIYWLIVATFIFILSMLTIRLQPIPPDDMMPFYESLGEDVSEWASEFRKFMHAKAKKEKTRTGTKAEGKPPVAGQAPRSDGVE